MRIHTLPHIGTLWSVTSFSGDQHAVEDVTAFMHLELPSLPRLKRSLDVTAEAQGFRPGSRVVGQILADNIAVRALAVDMEKILRHPEPTTAPKNCSPEPTSTRCVQQCT